MTLENGGEVQTLEYSTRPMADEAPWMLKPARVLNLVSLTIDALLVIAWLPMGFSALGDIANKKGDLILAAAGMVTTVGMGTLKLIGIIKIARREKNAWIWGFIGGIAGCMEAWLLIVGWLSVVAGIFSIVTYTRPKVRKFLAHERELRFGEGSSS